MELDLTRYELGLSRTFSDTWDAFVRIPYFVKDQTAGVFFPGEGTPEERDAAIRAGYAHHRTEVYEGYSDFETGAGWRKRGVFGEGSILRLLLGVALPVGETESNPLTAGDLGLEHLHIQFGNGTFDPMIDFYAGIPLAKKWAFSLYGKGRFPIYENNKGYLGSIEGTLIPRLTYLANKKLSLSTGLAANYYGYSEWDGTRDPNSGQLTLNGILSVGYKFSEHFTANASVMLPLYTDSFSDEDALDPEPVFSVSAAWTF